MLPAVIPLATAWKSTALSRQHRDGLDLDERALAQQPPYHHAGRRRVLRLEELPPDRGRLPVVLGRDEVLGRLHDVLEARPGLGQDPGELLEDVAGLPDDVAGQTR